MAVISLGRHQFQRPVAVISLGRHQFQRPVAVISLGRHQFQRCGSYKPRQAPIPEVWQL